MVKNCYGGALAEKGGHYTNRRDDNSSHFAGVLSARSAMVLCGPGHRRGLGRSGPSVITVFN